MNGKVILVGAGPGDPGLLTVKSLAAIESADVVVYDRLVSPAVMACIPEGAEKINVGKASSNHTVPQDEINRILLYRAQEGKNVVRLKGGDPFMFGRGGEELELLAQHGIPFEVVPGVTSAIAAPAYGGIPVTHRDFCSSLHIITGHARAGKPLEIDFAALLRIGGTYVFLMGVAALPAICAGLLDAGIDPDMPAALVENGTTPAQRRVNATVGTLIETAKREKIKSPAIIIVGKVCSLADDFDWFDRLPLKGRKIIVTRPKERSGTLAHRLRSLGADVLEYPCIETAPMYENAADAIRRIGDYEWIALTSPAGVGYLMELISRQNLDVRALGGVKLAAIGQGTAQELRKFGLIADYVPETYDAEHLGAGLAVIAKGRVLILRAQEGSPDLTAALDNYDDVALYKTIYENPQSDELREMIAAPTMVTFTSASTVKGFVSSVGEDADFSAVTGICIGKQTAAEAGKHGIRTVTARAAKIDELVNTILEGI